MIIYNFYKSSIDSVNKDINKIKKTNENQLLIESSQNLLKEITDLILKNYCLNLFNIELYNSTIPEFIYDKFEVKDIGNQYFQHILSKEISMLFYFDFVGNFNLKNNLSLNYHRYFKISEDNILLANKKKEYDDYYFYNIIYNADKLFNINFVDPVKSNEKQNSFFLNNLFKNIKNNANEKQLNLLINDLILIKNNLLLLINKKNKHLSTLPKLLDLQTKNFNILFKTASIDKKFFLHIINNYKKILDKNKTNNRNNINSLEQIKQILIDKSYLRFPIQFFFEKMNTLINNLVNIEGLKEIQEQRIKLFKNDRFDYPKNLFAYFIQSYYEYNISTILDKESPSLFLIKDIDSTKPKDNKNNNIIIYFIHKGAIVIGIIIFYIKIFNHTNTMLDNEINLLEIDMNNE